MRHAEGDGHDLPSEEADNPPVELASTELCAWCGIPIAEAEAFVLRVGARLCPACAKRVGDIAAEQSRKK